MIRSIIYKEWLKIRYYWLIAFFFNILLFAYLFINIRHLFVLEPAQMVWYNAIHIGTLFYDDIKYLMPATGILIGAAQFIPEADKERLRLSLHLPVRLETLALFYILIGISFVAATAVIDCIFLSIITGFFYPQEVAVSAALTALPWSFSGFPAYLGTSLVILETQWPVRLFYLIISAGFACLFYQSNDYNSYVHVMGRLAVLSGIFIPALILPVYRFRNRGGRWH